MIPLSSIALAQINPTVGDIDGNAALLTAAYEQAKTQGAKLVVAPELALLGYPPEDLVLMSAFRAQAMRVAQELAAITQGGPALLFGGLWEEGDKVYNAALLADDGKIVHVQPKTALPNYGVFDEKRLFTAGAGPRVCEWGGVKLGILVCEDMWHPSLAQELAQQGAQLILVINASPFEAGKLLQRKARAAEAAKLAGVPLIYVNMVGGQDDIVFDGGSFALSPAGEVLAQLPEFESAVALLNTPPASVLPQEETLWKAMVLSLRDYVHKNGFKGVLLGLSGGIDSAVSVAVAVDALGAQNVEGILLPSPYTSAESIEDAQESARMLGIATRTLPITPLMEAAQQALEPVIQAPSGWMEEVAIGGNLQARIRGQLLMALSNASGKMLMNTSNKSEAAVGYSTLYGDSCGAYCVLKDLYKTEVFALAKWRNTKGAAIPARSISKPPSAELKPDQKDEDQLPPYALLDAILRLHLEGRKGRDEIAAAGFDAAVVARVLHLVRISEYKRRQSCPGVKLSPMLFGKDRRYPLTNRCSI